MHSLQHCRRALELTLDEVARSNRVPQLALQFGGTGPGGLEREDTRVADRRQDIAVARPKVRTLLLCDAWFDVTLNVRTSGFLVSLLSALLIEIPLAVIAILGARRLLRLTIARIRSREGLVGPVPSLWKIPLFGPDEGGLRRDPAPPSPAPSVPSPRDGLVGEASGEQGSNALR